MDMSFLSDNLNAIVMLLLGIIAICFPLVSTATLGIFIGIIFLFVAVLLFISGSAELAVSRVLGLFSIVLALLCIVFSYYLIFNPATVSLLISIVIYLIGFFTLVSGILGLIGGRYYEPFSLMGLTTIVFGLLYIIVGAFVRDPVVLGVLIGLWLIISALADLFVDNSKNYIDV